MRTEHTNDGIKHMVECFLCRREFQFGPNRYAGRGVGAWKVRVCEQCEAANHDGLVTQQHPRLMQHLADQGIAYRLNAKGHLPIPLN